MRCATVNGAPVAPSDTSSPHRNPCANVRSVDACCCARATRSAVEELAHPARGSARLLSAGALATAAQRARHSALVSLNGAPGHFGPAALPAAPGEDPLQSRRDASALWSPRPRLRLAAAPLAPPPFGCHLRERRPLFHSGPAACCCCLSLLVALCLQEPPSHDRPTIRPHWQGATWFGALGAAVYLAYVPVSAALFDRMAGALHVGGSATFCIQAMDAGAHALARSPLARTPEPLLARRLDPSPHTRGARVPPSLPLHSLGAHRPAPCGSRLHGLHFGPRGDALARDPAVAAAAVCRRACERCGSHVRGQPCGCDAALHVGEPALMGAARSVQRAACSVQRAACSVQRAACSVQRAALSCQCGCGGARTTQHGSVTGPETQ